MLVSLGESFKGLSVFFGFQATGFFDHIVLLIASDEPERTPVETNQITILCGIVPASGENTI
jgi:hypothetical protein